jgi:hypothetical protein
MATFLELGIFKHFAGVFTFLLVYVLIFALLEFGKPFGRDKENKGLHAIIALAFAALSVMSSSIVRMVSFMIPWFLIAFLVVFFILFVVRMFGTSEEKIKLAGTSTEVRVWTIIIAIVILIFAFGTAFGQEQLERGTGEEGGDDLPPVEGTGDIEGEELSEGGQLGSPEATSTADYGKNVINTIVNPKVLGLILLLIIAVFAIFLLAD